jgi:glycosyltransferase involved in cell wall biosynthesis
VVLSIRGFIVLGCPFPVSSEVEKQVRLAVISTMRGSPWGGSEELWATVAGEACRQGFDVGVSVYDWQPAPPKTKALAGQGVHFFKRPLHAIQETPSAWSRVTRWIPGQNAASQAGPSPFAPLFEFGPDIILISQGGTYDAVLMDHLCNDIYACAKPYLVISQFNADWMFPDASTREKAISFFARAGKAAFVSNANRSMTERQLGAVLPNSLIVANPVNLEGAALVEWPAGDVPYFGVVARLEATYKGQDLIIDTLSAPAWKERAWRLRFYGEGPDLQYLKKLAAARGISDRVEFAGHVADVRQIWASNHLLVLPSRAEGLPLALIEALICGRPAVVTDVGGNADVVTEGETGFIAPAATTGSISTAMERAWHSKADWLEMGRRANRCMTERLDPHPGRTLLDLLIRFKDTPVGKI